MIVLSSIQWSSWNGEMIKYKTFYYQVTSCFLAPDDIEACWYTLSRLTKRTWSSWNNSLRDEALHSFKVNELIYHEGLSKLKYEIWLAVKQFLVRLILHNPRIQFHSKIGSIFVYLNEWGFIECLSITFGGFLWLSFAVVVSFIFFSQMLKSYMKMGSFRL